MSDSSLRILSCVSLSPLATETTKVLPQRHTLFFLFNGSESLPLQVLVDIVVAVVAGQPDQDARGTATLPLATQAAVAHPAAQRAGPGLREKRTGRGLHHVRYRGFQ